MLYAYTEPDSVKENDTNPNLMPSNFNFNNFVLVFN